MGGLDGGPVETMVIMEELGRGLVVEPYLPTIVLCGGILNRHGSAAQKEGICRALLPVKISGRWRLTSRKAG